MACGDSHVAMVCWADLRDFDPVGSCTGATDSEDTLSPEDDRPAAAYSRLCGLLRLTYLRGLAAFGGHLSAITEKH